MCGYDDNEPVRYRGSLVYNDGTFESASFGGGRIVGTNNGANSEVHYFLTDHLGSTRVVAKVTPTGRIDLDRKDYYPFGKEWQQSGMPTSENRYMFSGKERSDICLENDYTSILPVYDFGARSYYPEGVLFLQQDPLLEKYFHIGPYNYCAGNPVKFADKDGRKIVDAKGAILYQNGAWTKAASGTDAMRVGIAMMKTNFGTSIWNEMSEASYNITITINDGKGTQKGELGYSAIHRNSEGEIVGVDICIFKGSIEKQVEPQYSSERAKRLRPLSEDDRIGVIGVHEGRHSVDEEIPQEDKSAREKNAVDAEKRHINELEQEKTIVTNDINFNKPSLKF